MRDDPEADFYHAWNAGQVSRVSDGERMKPTINNQRPWVGLTASAILNLMPSSIPADHDGALMEFARAIEAKLKERNT
jgi:hypothetical protein